MSIPSDEAYLRDIIDLITEIEALVACINEAQFIATDTTRSAVLLKLIFVGEATRHISDGLRDRYPHIRWSRIVGFRNVAVHQYRNVDWGIVWRTASNDAPAYRDQVSAILNAEFSE